MIVTPSVKGHIEVTAQVGDSTHTVAKGAVIGHDVAEFPYVTETEESFHAETGEKLIPQAAEAFHGTDPVSS
jgi:hypothetical protein